jgi:beta-1,4-mannosyltransferase
MIVRLLGRNPELAVDDALRTLSALEWANPDHRPAVVAYLPSYFGNPFQSLLYSQLPAYGLHAAPAYTAEQATAFAEQVSGTDLDLIVHAHWLHMVTMDAEDEAEARDAAKGYLEQLHRAKELGARVLWTVHNVLPHDSQFEEVDVELSRDMGALADRIHLMNPRTRELVAPWFQIPEDKTFVTPHPGYHGVYPSWMRRDEARRHLGIPPNAVVFLLIGAVKPYKGITELLAAFDALSRLEPERFVLLVAGNPGEDEETQRFVERAIAHPAVYTALRKIPEDQMQIFLRAADIGVYPYRRSLNSGAYALGLTFGLPAVLPVQSGQAATAHPSYVETYDATDPQGLPAALSAAQRLVSDEARAAARAAGDGTAPDKASRTFAHALRTWLSGERT